MLEDNEVLDAKFLLDWNEDPTKFKFYLEKFIPSKSLSYLSSVLYAFILFVLSEGLTLFILSSMSPIGQDSYNLFKNVFVFGGLFLLSFLSFILFIFSLIEFMAVQPRFKLNKKSTVYITDGNGLYVANYVVGSDDKFGKCTFPIMADKIVKNFNGKKMKLDSKFFTSICYIDSYNVVNSCKDYIILDIPSGSSIYDDLNDFEITSSVEGFSDLCNYIDSTEGGYYLD